MKIQLKKLTFYFAWIIYIFNYIILEQSQFKNIMGGATPTRAIKMIAVAMLLISIFYRRKVAKRNFEFGALIIIIFAMAYFTADSWTVLFWGLFSLAAIDNIKYKEFLEIDIKIRTLLYLIVFLCAVSGVLKNETFLVYGNEKATLGYVHYNMFGMNMGVLITEIVALYRDDAKNKKIMYLVAIAICVFQALVGTGRTGLYAGVVVVILSAILENEKIRLFVEKHNLIFSLTPFVFALISYGISYAYDSSNKIMRALNYISSTRIGFSKQFLEKYKLSILGHHLYINNDATVGVYSALDMGYIRVGLEYGILILLLMLVVFYFIQRKALNTYNISLYLCGLYFCMTLLVATSVMNIANNWMLIFSVQVLIERKHFLKDEIGGR